MRTSILCIMLVVSFLTACQLLDTYMLPTYDQQIQHGKQLFYNGTVDTPACSGCHIASNSEHRLYIAAPKLVGISNRAQVGQPTVSADEYLYQSIINPGVYLVEGFPNSMFPDYGIHLTDYDIRSLIAYLQTL